MKPNSKSPRNVLTFGALVLLAVLFADRARASDDMVLRSTCDGRVCSTYYGPRTYDSSARVVAVPVDATPNTNPNWGRGCRSCIVLPPLGDK